MVNKQKLTKLETAVIVAGFGTLSCCAALTAGDITKHMFNKMANSQNANLGANVTVCAIHGCGLYKFLKSRKITDIMFPWNKSSITLCFMVGSTLYQLSKL